MLDSCCIQFFFTWIVLPLVIFVFLFTIILKASTIPYAQMPQTDNENFFLDPNDKRKKVPFPSSHTGPTVDLSVIVPSYLEEKRLGFMLDEALGYLEERKDEAKSTFTYEIIVVDDGSTDKTSEVALNYSQKYTTDIVRVLTLETNRGKGGATQMGVSKSRGKLILFADADGATRFKDVERLEREIKKEVSSLQNIAIEDAEIIACGSRKHLEQDSVAKRSKFRTFLMHGFHFLVYFLCVRGIRDTQCGFKLLTRSAAFKTFANLHVKRWAFDVDLLYIAQCFNMKLLEVDVNWEEKDGSKIYFWSYVQMGKDLISIRGHYLLGAWKLNPNLTFNEPLAKKSKTN